MSHLILSRKQRQVITIGPDITITILEVKGRTVRVGIDAPKELLILRAEVEERRDKTA
jgi:carbon storage regulator CsrA